MAFLVQENSSCVNFNNDLLMSFLEESPNKEYDDKELDSLMRSLEAEINPNRIDIRDLLMDLGSLSNGEEAGNDMNWHMDTQGKEVDFFTEFGDGYLDLSFDDVFHEQMCTVSRIETDTIGI
ncbi:hypothetical protein V6N13_025510 [Hibiscus sabdariffa]|uniref:Uncharacterized protein n=1 Tax=Hibiscus sabdariffa TaxID=183260 RepID=A0ABR2P8I6_9ROSI